VAGLVGPDGKPISSAQFTNKKADPPKTGAAFGHWAGRDVTFASLPGGGVVQFDLSKLTTTDYRNMLDHYQVNSSQAVLSFMQHQSDWFIECDDKKIADLVEGQIRERWTQLNRAMAQANWAGYSPNVLEWENDINSRQLVLNKIKDLIPEECRVEWKEELGWAPPGRTPPKFKTFDGIKQFGQGWPIPVDNSFWYPLLMQNGDYYGKKLLRPAFTSWFFSMLVHLFANRYYERFGEPTPIGRAPFDDELAVDVDSTPIRGVDYMMSVLQNLRNRGVVVLPNDVTEFTSGSSSSQKMHYDYDIEYLESQMRGADFERYLTRLDEEISLGMFTPILLMRTADVGSYNLGVGHMQMYLWMLNAMNDDRAYYINKYVIKPMVDYNISPNAPRARIAFRKLGNTSSEVLQAMLVALIQHDKAVPDLEQLGKMTGMTLKQVRQTTKPPPAPGQQDPAGPSPDPAAPTEPAGPKTGNRDVTEVYATTQEILARVRPQVERAFREHTFGADTRLSMGYKRKFEKALEVADIENAVTAANQFYRTLDHWLNDVVALGESEFTGPDTFMAMFSRVVEIELERIVNA
jgi:hypothetical protein